MPQGIPQGNSCRDRGLPMARSINEEWPLLGRVTMKLSLKKKTHTCSPQRSARSLLNEPSRAQADQVTTVTTFTGTRFQGSLLNAEPDSTASGSDRWWVCPVRMRASSVALGECLNDPGPITGFWAPYQFLCRHKPYPLLIQSVEPGLELQLLHL
jgi:hypothetical protein